MRHSVSVASKSVTSMAGHLCRPRRCRLDRNSRLSGTSAWEACVSIARVENRPQAASFIDFDLVTMIDSSKAYPI